MKRTQVISAFLAVMISLGSCANANPQTSNETPRLNVAVFIFDGVQMIDYTGPYEAFSSAMTSAGLAFNVYTVAEKPGAMKTNTGMSISPQYSFEDVPKPDIVIVPGGMTRGVLGSSAALKWIQDEAQSAKIVMGVCTGAFILAKAGVLDGLEATTSAGRAEGLQRWAPKAKVVDDRRVVDAGRIVTTAGGSSSIDGALHVIERMQGKAMAQSSALMMEYNWDQDSKWVRGTLADKYMSFNYDVADLILPDGWKSITLEGTADRWESRWSVATKKPTEVFESINNSIAQNKRYAGPTSVKWIKQGEIHNKSGDQTTWKFTDEKGAPWRGTVRLEPVAGATNQFILRVSVAKDDKVHGVT